ncbi:MAG TPA: short-chain dehydrogenase/reductase [Solirubrobacteraceae bacterium]|nr:short-chain dehydrogenase/reductase [Solirubrobacteraceae bacterium]
MRRRRFDVAGKTVLITGAARGIGAATAERLHSRGARVALVGLEPERLEALAGRLGQRAAWFEADVTDAGALDRAVDGTLERFGAIDVAIANAGVHYVGALATAPVEQVERELAVNLLGVWRTDRAVLPHVVARRGYLLNVSSASAVMHFPLMGAYAASKSGVEALSNCLRVEIASTGARVGCTYFGFMDTDLVRASMSHPSSRAAEGLMPAFVRRTWPASEAVDAIERGIERRSARIWAPRYMGPALLLRGVAQPLTEWRLSRAPEVPEALRLADPRTGVPARQDPLLGVAVDGAGPAVSG